MKTRLATVFLLGCLFIMPVAYTVGKYIAFPECIGQKDLDLCIQICKLKRMINE